MQFFLSTHHITRSLILIVNLKKQLPFALILYLLFHKQDNPIGKVLNGVKQSYMFDLLLETRKEDERFKPYKPGGKLDLNYCSFVC